MVNLILFRDFDLLRRPDRSGFNRVGYLSRQGVVVYDRWRTVRQVPFERVRKRAHVIIRSKSSFDEAKVESFFFDNHPSIDLFRQGILALKENYSDFFAFPVKLPLLTRISVDEHERRWKKLRSVLKTGDMIATFDTISRMSRLISLLDSSPWSHVGMYIGKGQIAETLTKGQIERGIDAYRSPRYRLGVYRPKGMPPISVAKARAISRSMIGGHYDYLGAFVLGLRVLFRIKGGGPRFRSIGEFLRTTDIRLIHVV